MSSLVTTDNRVYTALHHFMAFILSRYRFPLRKALYLYVTAGLAYFSPE
ncbi:MAG: hypothetical protein ACPLVD_09250 [Dictyoglomus turgidum]